MQIYKKEYEIQYLCSMKVYLSILAFLLCSCYNNETKIPKNILSKTEFKNILKEIHLAEAAFELNKREGLENAKTNLKNNYQSIYKTHNISPSNFSKSLDYYAKNPAILEEIYSAALERLTQERSTLDQQ